MIMFNVQVIKVQDSGKGLPGKHAENAKRKPIQPASRNPKRYFLNGQTGFQRTVVIIVWEIRKDKGHLVDMACFTRYLWAALQKIQFAKDNDFKN